MNSREPLIILTGLPRSGTSLLMQMLHAGGIPICRDDQRGADEDNPLGYFEDIRVKSLLIDNTWLNQARGKALKIVIPLVRAVPPGLPARVILIVRHVGEVIASQAAMLARKGVAPSASSAVLQKVYAAQLEQSTAFLQATFPGALLTLHHHEVIANPTEAAAKINEFLGGHLDSQAMANCVTPGLHRQRNL